MDDYRIKWHAPEYEHREHTQSWYWWTGGIVVVLSAVFFVFGNALLSIILLLGMGLLLASSTHPPQILEYELSKKGVRAGKTFYPWKFLESFWITEEYKDGKHSNGKILLTSKKSFMPLIVVPLGDTSTEEVHKALSSILPEHPQAEPLPDRVMRRLGF
ncbi:MAG: hypothetical protein PHS95_00985 [Candidatus Pacebacteria bacterium]|nr:hypothetical protein [Candidatus Paceibacterota bacterium]